MMHYLDKLCWCSEFKLVMLAHSVGRLASLSQWTWTAGISFPFTDTKLWFTLPSLSGRFAYISMEKNICCLKERHYLTCSNGFTVFWFSKIHPSTLSGQAGRAQRWQIQEIQISHNSTPQHPHISFMMSWWTFNVQNSTIICCLHSPRGECDSLQHEGVTNLHFVMQACVVSWRIKNC